MSNGLRSATTPFAQALNAVRSSTIRSCFLGSCLAALVIGAAPAAAATKAEVRGKAFVTLHCSKCHAIGLKGSSPNRRAPALRTLGKRYPLENLEEAFAEGVIVDHGPGEMPSFQLGPQSISDMIAYLKAISRK